jgi:hypothetical protein
MANPLLNVPWEACLLEPRHDGALETMPAESVKGIAEPVVTWVVRGQGADAGPTLGGRAGGDRV